MDEGLVSPKMEDCRDMFVPRTQTKEMVMHEVSMHLYKELSEIVAAKAKCIIAYKTNKEVVVHRWELKGKVV